MSGTIRVVIDVDDNAFRTVIEIESEIALGDLDVRKAAALAGEAVAMMVTQRLTRELSPQLKLKR